MSDDQIGLYWGDGPNQGNASENTIHAVKIITDSWNVEENSDAKDVVYGLYPNPATDYVVVKSSQDVEANISIVNLVGQTVKQFNKSLKMGHHQRQWFQQDHQVRGEVNCCRFPSGMASQSF